MERPIVLLIDLDGVIRRWDGDDSHIEASHGLPIGALRKVAFAPELLGPAIEGAVSDEAWRSNVARELGRLHPASAAQQAVERWSLSPGEVSSEVLAILDRCRPDLRIVLATNATSRLDADLHALGIADRFHAIANSSALRAVKPEAAFFEKALRLASAEPLEALFVDDTFVNVNAAARLGIPSYRFEGAAGLLRFLGQAGAVRENAL